MLFAVLVGFTSRWTVFDAKRCATTAKNRRELLEEQQIRRGLILAADGTVLARSLKQPDGSYVRTYPTGRAVRPRRRLQLRRQRPRRARALLQRRPDRAQRRARLAPRPAAGPEQQGDDVVTTLDPAAQRVALQQLAGRKGAVVALDPRTGAVKVMASIPGYDPNTVEHQQQFNALNRDHERAAGQPRTQAGYPPGSTFKVVTATAAIDAGTLHAGLDDQRAQRRARSRACRCNNDSGETSATSRSPRRSPSRSTPCSAQVGEKLGKATMAKYMDRFGFDRKPRARLPARRARGQRRAPARAHAARRPAARSTSGAWASARTSSR